MNLRLFFRVGTLRRFMIG